jgi:hypothetical protein
MASFEELADAAIEGLREYYPGVLTSGNRSEILAEVGAAYTATRNSQGDYEFIRDRVERVAKHLEAAQRAKEDLIEEEEGCSRKAPGF